MLLMSERENNTSPILYPFYYSFFVISGDALPEGAEQGDVERRRQLDDHLDGQAGVHVLRGDGAGEEPGDPGAPGAQPLPQRRRRRRHARADWRVLQPSPPRLVRRRRIGDDVPQF